MPFNCTQTVARCTSVISVTRFVWQQVSYGNTRDFIRMKGHTNVLYVMLHLKTRPISRGMVLNTPESRSSNVMCVTNYFLINVSTTNSTFEVDRQLSNNNVFTRRSSLMLVIVVTKLVAKHRGSASRPTVHFSDDLVVTNIIHCWNLLRRCFHFHFANCF